MKQLITFSFFVFMQISVSAQPFDMMLPFEKTQSILLDAGIQDLSRDVIDQSATGQIGFRIEGPYGKFEVKFTVASNAKAIKSDNVSEYTRSILNPNFSQTGVDAFKVSILRRHFTRKSNLAQYLMFLERNELITPQQYRSSLEEYPKLKKHTKPQWAFGWKFDLNVSNTSWTDSKDITQDGNIVAIYPALAYNYRTMLLKDNLLDFFVGVGPTFRWIAGDFKDNPSFVEGIIGNKDRQYIGPQFFATLFVNGFYAKADYAIFNKDNPIAGLTGGRFFVSIGVQAKIGNISVKEKLLSILASDLPSGYGK